jgi:hypothetical protein
MRSAILIVFLALSGCGPVNAIAPKPAPNVIAAGKSDQSFTVQVTNFPAGPAVCSQEGGLKDVCVTHMKESLSDGLNDVLSGYMKPGSGGYTAEFKFVEFKHTAASGSVAGEGVVGMPAVQVSLRWQFVLKNAAGEPVVQLAETTVGPNRIFNTNAIDAAIGALLNSTLESIAKSLNDSKFWEHS